MKDSIDVALDLDEKEVYSHIAHESAEDIIRIISSLDAERAKNRGEIIYYEDDWDDLIRKRIQKGKRHTAFDFYNPALLNIWEKKVHYIKKTRNYVNAGILLILILFISSIGASVLLNEPLFILGTGILPLTLFLQRYRREVLDFGYYQLTQFFIDELKQLIKTHSLDSNKYRFKIFTHGYFGVLIRRAGMTTFAIIKNERDTGNNE